MASEDHQTQEKLAIVSFVLGPALTNVYLVGEPTSGEAVVIDPAWDGELIVEEANRRGWRISQIWLTHAHFDHFGGASAVAKDSGASVALHPEDQPLWRFGGGAVLFGVQDLDAGPEPTVALEHGMMLHLGGLAFEVRHTPGHSPGHVVFVVTEAKTVFCGDLIFRSGVGRTDLPGGNWHDLVTSIRDQIFTLPDETRLLSGHGPATTVGIERRTNPFVTL